ncbi:MAG: hypothetical protein J6336_04360 [Kiritimatiellae bacterium]|nr:hypothetical protein [Kiritimatiellia bacterium]
MSMRWLIGVLCCMVFGMAGAEEASARQQGLFRCQIHRGGGAADRPDNALETFLWAWGHGVAPEADARLTKDGVAIALHDDNLKRVGRGISQELQTRKINTLNWDEIRDVDTGSYLNAAYASTRISTMESIFAAMKGRPDRLLYLDEKGAPPEMMAEMAIRFGVEEQVYYCSPRFQLIPRWKKAAPKGKSMVWLGTWPRDNSPESIQRAEAFLDKTFEEMKAVNFDGIDQIQIHVRTDLSKPDPFCPSTPYLKRVIEMLHQRGILVQTITWTEGNNPAVYEKLWELGFDSFATDYPFVLFDVMKRLK